MQNSQGGNPKQRQINILFLYWGRKGGGAKYSFEIAKELSKKKDTNFHLSLSKKCELLQQYQSLFAPTLYVDTYESILGFLHTFVIRKYSLKKQLEEYIRENNIDVIIIGMDFFWGHMIQQAAINAGVKTILVVHEPQPHPKESLPMIFFKNLNFKKSIPGADRIVALTKHVKELITELYEVDPENISVIPHGIFSYYKTNKARQFKKDHEKIKILYFGRIDYYKGLDILLDAFYEIENIRNDVQLEIWGSGDISDYQNQIGKIQNIRIENRWINEDEISEAFQNGDVCVLPYREASQSGVVGIAAHAAMPIVACPSDGLKDQLEKYGAIFSDDFSSRSLKKSLLKLIQNPDLYHQLSLQAIEYGSQISWSGIAEDFYEISSGLISDANE